MSSRSDDCPVGWKPTGTPSSSMAAHKGSISGSWTWRPLTGFGLPMTATAPGRRGGHRGVELVVHEHLPPTGAVEDGHVDALDVHGLDVGRRVVAARVRD